MTETLAHVYLEQKKYEKAITAFTILSLKYPEKSSFFANQIKAIKNLQKNKLIIMSYFLFLVLIIIVSFLLILVIMVQNPKGGGLSSSFGGGGTQNIGGVQNTTNFLDKSTWTLAIALFALILFSNFAIPRNNDVDLKSEIEKTSK